MNKIKLSLKIYGEPILRKKAARVEDFNAELQEIFNQMVPIMRAHSGIGLAATQVGVDMRLFIVDVGDGVYKICNPKIVKRGSWQTMEEGCLSLPGLTVKLRRLDKITVQYQNEFGRLFQLECCGLFSCAIQHELDHIDGKLIIDYLPLAKRIFLRDKLKRLKDSKR